MNNKLIAIGVGLVGYGALVGWAVTADHYERKMKRNQLLLGGIIDRQSRELESSKTLLLRSGINTESSSDYIARMNAEHADEEIIDPDAVEEFVEPDVELIETPDETRSNLQALIDRYNSDPDAVETFEHMATNTIRDNGPDNTPPFVISKEIYTHDEEGEDYEKIALTYFPKEHILLDEDEDPIDHKDIDALVGWKNLNRFGDESGEADVVFVRCRRILTDFEVIRDTENEPPTHIRYGMSRDEYELNKAASAGLVRFRRGDV